MKKTIFIVLSSIFILLAINFLSKISIPLLSFLNSKPNYNASDEVAKSSKEKAIINDIVNKVTNKPIIGIHYKMIDKQSALENKLVEGAYVTQVIKNSPAEKTGLQEEDIITEIDGRKIAGLQQESIYNLISTLKPKSRVNLLIWRNKLIKSFTITLE